MFIRNANCSKFKGNNYNLAQQFKPYPLKKTCIQMLFDTKYEHDNKYGLVYRLHNGCSTKERFVLQPYKVCKCMMKEKKTQRKWEINATITLVSNTQFLFKTSMGIIDAWEWELRREESREGAYEFLMSSRSSGAFTWWFVSGRWRREESNVQSEKIIQ